jgi:hypothetical protein
LKFIEENEEKCDENLNFIEKMKKNEKKKSNFIDKK